MPDRRVNDCGIVGGQVEIVIVEDNPNDSELILRSFKKHNLGNPSIVLKDGAEALDFFSRPDVLASKSIKVVLLDLKLPKVDGIEVLRQLKRQEPTKHFPVVILTSSTEQRDLKECYELGVNSYVAKPIKFDEFASTVANLGLYWVMTNRLPT